MTDILKQQNSARNTASAPESGSTMRSKLLVHPDGDRLHHWLCPCKDCKAENDDFCYSHRRAKDIGWKFTTDIKFSIDGEMVAVCPSCAKNINWSNA